MQATRLRLCLGHVGLFVVFTVTWLAVLAVGPPVVLGWKAVAVTSGSMQPSIRAGDLVVAAPFDGSRLEAGAIVVFRNPSGPGLIAHRVRSRSADSTYLTAGDANPNADSTPLRKAQVVGVGRMIVPLAGLPTAWARAGEWSKLALLALGLALALWCARFALRHDDDPPRRPRAGAQARLRRMRPVLPLVVVLTIIGTVAAIPLTAGALFTATTGNSGNAWTASAVFVMRLATGTYVGDANDNRAITGVGFRPDAVFVKCTCGLAGMGRTSTMVGDASKVLGATSALMSDGVQSLDADGFTLGTDTKVNGGSSRTYHWVALQTGSDFKVGSYLGDGTDNRSITGVGFAPAWVLTIGDGNDSTVRPSSLAGDASFPLDGTSQFTNRIQALESDGFQIGSNAATNESGTTFHYLAWKAGTNVKQGTYLGDASDNRSIPGVGFGPALVWVKRDTSNQATWRPASATGDVSLFWGATASNADRIQALEGDGFQIGTNAQVNTLNATYHYLALKDGTS
ncbi:MAG: signal peptidase I [Acidimicrobiia bacterium]